MTKDAPETLLAQGVVQPVIRREDLVELRASLAAITLRDELLAYLVDVRARHTNARKHSGRRGPRASQSLIMAARAYAAMSGRDL